jgi:hypothetical protein
MNPFARDLLFLTANSSSQMNPFARDLLFLTANSSSQMNPFARDLLFLTANSSLQMNPFARDLLFFNRKFVVANEPIKSGKKAPGRPRPSFSIGLNWKKVYRA